MVDEERFSDIKELQGDDRVANVKKGEEYILVESVADADSEDYRDLLATKLVDSAYEYGMELRTKENTDGYVGIISEGPEHPVQKVPIFCGYLGLSDRETYQTLVKTTELVDTGLFDSDNPSEFAASVIQVLSISFKPEPYDTGYLCKAFDLDAKLIQKYTTEIIEHIDP